MVTLEEVAGWAEGFPKVTTGEERGQPTWSVNGKLFAWIRPFRKTDLKRFGDVTPPREPILGVKVDDLGEKEAVLAANHKGFFTIPHFDGYPAVLIELRLAGKRAVREAIEDAWLAAAPKGLIDDYLANKH